MADSPVLLALDSGSQSSRALLLDGSGALLGKASRAHRPFLHPFEGAVEQDLLDIRDCLFDSVRSCVADWGGDPRRIVAASLTTQRDAWVALDDQDQPLTHLQSWLDRRTAKIDDEPSRLLRWGLKAAGRDSLIPRLLMRSKTRRWRTELPEVVAATRRVLNLEAWLHLQLVGRAVNAPGGLAGAIPLDLKGRGYDRSALMCRLLGWEPAWFADVVEAGSTVGTLRDELSADLGLPPGLPFIACGGDKQAEVIGSGLRSDQPQLAVSLGTASSIAVPWARPKKSELYRWLAFCGCEPGVWHLEWMVFRGMWTARWFAEQFGRDLVERAQTEGRPVEALLCDEAEGVPPGSDGVVTWPRWSPGLHEASEVGTVLGLRETHTRAHAFRSLLEGIAYDLRRGREALERATGRTFTEVRVGGGGSRSDLVVRILADVLGLPVVRPDSEELSARGAAICAAVGGGVHPTYDAAIAAMVPSAPVIEPDPAAAALYDGLFRDVYVPGFDELKGLSRALARRR